MQLVHLASRLYGTPLLIARAKLDVILAVLGSRIGLPESDTQMALPAPRAALPALPVGIAVIPVHGTLVRRSGGVDAASGLTSYGELGARLDAALADPHVDGILLDIDSPGGEAGGVFELARRIASANKLKPVWAHAADSAYSAAYAIASSASRLTLSQTAGVGSIGVIALHVDQSVKDAKDGIAYTAIYAGSHKNDFSPHAPLSPEAATSLQAEVDRLYDIFVGHVALARGLDAEAIRAMEAGLVFGEAAVTAGLADAVASFEDVLGEFAAALQSRRRLTANGARASPGADISPAVASTHSSTKEKDMQESTTHQLPDTTPSESEPAPSLAAAAPAALSAAPPRADAQAIAEICLIAGCPERTAEFLASSATEAQVRRVLIDARAAQPEIRSHITADAGTTLRPEASPVVAAAKKLNSKE
jgi:signal peptide peptidase SppA